MHRNPIGGGELLLIGNPARRRKGGKKRKASPAQIAARARFAAMARARSGKGRSRGKGRTSVVIHANPVRRHRTRRNPINLGASFRSVVPMMKRSAVGAGGALLNDVAFGYTLPFLPAAMQLPVSAAGGVNLLYHGGKIASALALGAIAKHVPGVKPYAVAIAEGSMTVAFHDLGKQFIVGMGVPVPMGQLNPARVVPALPISQNLRGVGKYVGPGNTSVRGLGMYVGPSAREQALR